MAHATRVFGFTHENTESEIVEILTNVIKPYKEKNLDADVLQGQADDKLYYFIKKEAETTIIVTFKEKEIVFDIDSTSATYCNTFSLAIKLICTLKLKSAKPT